MRDALECHGSVARGAEHASELNVARQRLSKLMARLFGVKYFCRSTSIILAGSDGCSFDDAPFAGRCCDGQGLYLQVDPSANRR